MDKHILAEELISEEGIVLHAYQDHLGFWTLGIGRLIDKRKGGGITKTEALYLLNNDIESKYAELIKALPWVTALSDRRQRALCNMAFQMGLQNLLGFTTTLSLLKAGKFNEAADQALKSKWATQTPERAKRVAEMLRKG